MSDHSNNDLPARAAKKDAEFDRRVRTGLGALPLAGRQEWAERMSYADGRPLSEGEVREYIRGQRAAGTGRAEVRRSLVADDPLERRIGALNPEEVGLVLAGEWPVTP